MFLFFEKIIYFTAKIFITSKFFIVMKQIIALFTFYLLSFQLFSQKVVPIELSDSLIARGVQLHDEDHFDDAIALYKKVAPDDPNYSLALYEIILSQFYNKQYDSAIYYGEKYYKVRKSSDENSHAVNSMIALANAHNKNYDVCFKQLDSLSQKFPNYFRYPYNKGEAYRLQEKYEQAFASYMKAVDINPNHYASHAEMANLAIKEGKMTEALLIGSFCILTEPYSNRSASMLQALNTLSAKKYESEDLNIDFGNGTNYEGIESMLRSQVALQKKYKIPGEQNASPIFKQLHLLLSSLQDYEIKDNFFDKNYTKFFKDLYAKGDFEMLTYYMMLSIKSAEVEANTKKHLPELVKFYQWLAVALPQNSFVRKKEIDGKMMDVQVAYSNNEMEYGQMKDTTRIGKWIKLYIDGTKQVEVNYKNGLIDGVLTEYYKDGKVSETTTFVAGKKNGAYKSYYKNGQLYEEANYQKDSLHGPASVYYKNGKLFKKITFDNNKKQGAYKEYYANGNLKEESNYENGEYSGISKGYLADGKSLMYLINYSKGLYNGECSNFFANGKTSKKGMYKDGILNGAYTSYFPNGEKKSACNYVNGQIVGDNLSYYSYGKMNTKETYNNKGKLIGYEDYDFDGKLYSKSIYKNDVFNKLIYYNPDGTEKQGEKFKNKASFTYRSFVSDAVISEGEMQNGKKIGPWKYYNVYGKLTEESSNNENGVNGVVKKYYSNGKLKSEYEMKDGVLEGFYKQYYPDGKLKMEGWNINDEENGYWYYYNVNGNIEKISYYYKGDVNGNLIRNDPDGKLQNTTYLELDDVKDVTYFDDSEKEIGKIVYSHVDTVIKVPTVFNYHQFTIDIKNGDWDGALVRQAFSNIPAEKFNYIQGVRYGSSVVRDPSGGIESDVNYLAGDQEGLSKYYFPNGNVRYQATNIDGMEYGTETFYYIDGKKCIEHSFSNGEKNGFSVYYSNTGEIYLKKYYQNDYLKFYIRNNAKGELKDTIYPSIEKANIVAKFNNGKTAFEENLEYGENTGITKIYYPDGKIFIETGYDKNNERSYRKTFYPNGNLFVSTPFKNGDFNGLVEVNNEDGSPNMRYNYSADALHGDCKLYDKTGKLIKSIKYRDHEVEKVY